MSVKRVSIDVTNTYQPDFGVTLQDGSFGGGKEQEETMIGITDYQPGNCGGFLFAKSKGNISE